MMPGYKRFIKKILLFSIPFWLHVAGYVVADPFMVIGNYDNFYLEREIPVALDRDYVSTMTYMRNREKTDYDSFIFGNSRSMYYEVSDWRALIGEQHACYHFDASAESLYGVLKKVEYLDANNDTIKNALFVIDDTLLEQAEPKKDSHLYYLSPVLESYRNVFGFHVAHWKSFLNLKFAYAVCDYYYSGIIKDYMVVNHFFENYDMEYDVVSNEVKETAFENEILAGTYYTAERMKLFEGVQHPTMRESVIKEEQKELLKALKLILDKHRSQYKIIISPLYNQIKLNKKDVTYLCNLFGSNRVFDYSGVNSITEDYGNYYEAAHYRPIVAKRILQDIYEKRRP